MGPGARVELEEHVRYVHTDDGVRLALTELALGERAELEREGRARAIDGADPRGLGAARPTFVLVHGFAQNRHAFLTGALPRRLLERGGRVLVAELRGHGRSRVEPGTSRAWSLATLLEHDLPAILERAAALGGVERVHLLGHSMGGILGYALLARSSRLASLTTFASPIHLGRQRTLLRLASAVAGPLVELGRAPVVPMDLLLGALAPLLTMPEARGGARLVQRVARLANPASAEPALLRVILEGCDPESPAVFGELARMAATGRAEVAGVDLVAALRAAPIPVAAIYGRDDVFTSRASVAVVEQAGARGPRLVLEVPDALHVDLVMGRHAGALADRLWDFVLSA